MSKCPPEIGNEIANIIKGLHDALWDIDIENWGADIRYTEEDVIYALKIFSHITMNVAIHRRIEGGETLKNSSKEIQNMGEDLRNFVINYTGFDPHSFYQKHGK